MWEMYLKKTLNDIAIIVSVWVLIIIICYQNRSQLSWRTADYIRQVCVICFANAESSRLKV